MMVAIRWERVPESWKNYLQGEQGLTPGGVLVVDTTWGRVAYYEDPAQFKKDREKGWLHADLFPYEADASLLSEHVLAQGEVIYE